MTRMSTVLIAFAVMIAGCDTDAKQSDPVPFKESVPAEASGTVREPLDGDATIHVTVTELPSGRIRLDGATNLPTNTKLLVSVKERMQGGVLGQTKCSVGSDGSFSSEAIGPTGGLRDGLYIAEVVMPIPRAQPQEVRRIIGENGENLTGPLVENGAIGVTLSAKKEFTIGGAQAVHGEQQREKDVEESTARLKYDICVQLERLLKFKDRKDFKTTVLEQVDRTMIG